MYRKYLTRYSRKPVSPDIKKSKSTSMSQSDSRRKRSQRRWGLQVRRARDNDGRMLIGRELDESGEGKTKE